MRSTQQLMITISLVATVLCSKLSSVSKLKPRLVNKMLLHAPKCISNPNPELNTLSDFTLITCTLDCGLLLFTFHL